MEISMIAIVAAFILFSSALRGVSSQSRGDWLCGQVRDYAEHHPNQNVIAFASGTYNFQGLVSNREITYEANGCDRGISGIGSALIGGSVGDVADMAGSTAEGLMPGVYRTTGNSFVNYMNPCAKFQLVAFNEGTFQRTGDGGYENWCFVGKHTLSQDKTHITFHRMPDAPRQSRSNLPVSKGPDYRCGAGIAVCPPAHCCGRDNYCAPMESPKIGDSCTAGCQPQYGYCQLPNYN